MNIAQNLPTALPIYDARHKQAFRHSYCLGVDRSLLAVQCRYDRLIQWVIKHTPETAETSVYLVHENDLSALDITALVSSLTFTETLSGAGYTYYIANADINQSTEVEVYSRTSAAGPWVLAGDGSWGTFVCDGGFYYLEIVIDETTYYSELMQMVDFPEFAFEGESDNIYTRIRIEALSDCMVGNVPTTLLPEGVPQKLFVNARAAEPQYTVVQTIGKDGEEDEKPLWAKVVKRYFVRFYAIESVADFVSTLPLYKEVYIGDQYGINTTVSDIEVKATWGEEGNGCLALVELSFKRDFVSNSECC